MHIYIAPQIKANANLYANSKLEADLQEKSSLLHANDPSIQALIRQIKSLTGVIRQQTIGLLEGKLQTARAQLASFTRPREIVLKHRELVRTALRDEQTVADLETQLQALRLEKARQTDPWELISTPTLLDKPVDPQEENHGPGLLAGAMAGSVIALIKDRRKGLVFSTYELRELLPCPMLKQLPPAKRWQIPTDLLAVKPPAG